MGLHLRGFCFILLFVAALLTAIINLSSPAESATVLKNETDLLSLLAFKEGISSDPNGALSSWNDSLHFCMWGGVTCSRRHPQRVATLNLTMQGLVGSLSPYIANLSFLRIIDLSSNNFQGHIPHEVGHLFRLRYLSLYANSFNGEIPSNLSHCSELGGLALDANKLVGSIPLELRSLPKLEWLILATNNLSGHVPPPLGNLSSLTILDLSDNSLEGSIPESLGQMASLQMLAVGGNKLSGYGMGSEASTYGDVYSYGIFLLEMFIGKRPTDDVFKDNLSIHQFAKMALPRQVLDIVDHRLLSEEVETSRDNGNKRTRSKMHECLLALVGMGVSCSSKLPKERLEMKDVVRELHGVRELYLGIKKYQTFPMLAEGPSYLSNY